MHGAAEEDAGNIALFREGQSVLDAVGHHGQGDIRHDPNQLEHCRARVEIHRLARAETTGRSTGDGLLFGSVLQGTFAGRKFAPIGLEANRSTVRAAQHSFAFELFEVPPNRLLRHASPLGDFRGAEAAAFVQFVQQPAVAINGKHEKRLGKCVF